MAWRRARIGVRRRYSKPSWTSSSATAGRRNPPIHSTARYPDHHRFMREQSSARGQRAEVAGALIARLTGLVLRLVPFASINDTDRAMVFEQALGKVLRTAT